jgi:hypothetical protein
MTAQNPPLPDGSLPAVSTTGLQEAEDEPFRVRTGPLEVSRGPEPKHGFGDIGYPRPDFVLFGIADPFGGVILFASDQMSQAELESKIQGFDLIPVGRALARVPDRRTTLKVEMRSFTMIRADTYGDALRSLMETWRPPEPGTRPALEA